MIRLLIEKEIYEYDLYAYASSFFPEKELKPVIAEDIAAVNDSIVYREDDASIFLGFYGGEELLSDASFEKKKEEEDAEELKFVRRLFIYECFADYTKKKLPWGALTGVRPAKLVTKLLDEDTAPELIPGILNEKYRVSQEKSELALSIARTEKEILMPFKDRNVCSIYIGIPFCPSTCLYCSFTSYPVKAFENRLDAYLEALAKELKALPEFLNGSTPCTVYVGGGTPTALDAGRLSILLDNIRDAVDINGLSEFTVEAGRPDSLDLKKLSVLKEAGVGRISVNPQTFKEETLKLIGRRHSAADVERAFYEAREAGFDNINMDMILGLPGESVYDIQKSFEEVKRYAPDSLTAHALSIKRASRMKKWVAEHGAVSGIDAYAAMEAAYEAAEYLSMKPYYIYRQKTQAGALENTGFAKEGKYGFYNIFTMEESQSIIALGAGTVSKRVYKDGSGRIERCDTHKDVDLYIRDIDAMIDRKRLLFEE